MSNDVAVLTTNSLTIQEIKAQVQLIQKVLEGVMIKDTHYGTIPGTPKPTLYKAGAEKILSTFRIAVVPVVEDLSGPDERRFRVVARGIALDGTLVGEGIGEASTDEEKYRWRGAVCAEEFDNTPEDRRRLKYARSKGGSGHYTVMQVRTVPADLANTVLKMAKKRAMIDLTLTSTACSDIFEQDLEDMDEEVRDNLISDRKKQERGNGKPPVNQPKATGEQNGAPAPGECITVGQQRMLGARIEEAGITAAAVIEYLNAKGMMVNVLADIEQSKLTEVVRAIGAGEIKPC